MLPQANVIVSCWLSEAILRNVRTILQSYGARVLPLIEVFSLSVTGRVTPTD